MAKKPTVSTTFNAIDKITSPMKKMTKNVKKFAIGATVGFVAVAAAGAKVVQSVNKFAEAGDEIAKTARQIGLSSEALQELRFAADRSGVSGESFSNAMKKMNKNVGDLRANTGMLTTYLNKSNPALAEQLKNVESNEEAFALLTEEIANIKNPMDKAALAQAAFGRAGQDLIVMTENGTEGIKDLREEAKKYGNIISNEAAASSERFVDSMTNMKAAIQGVKNRALAPLMESLQPIIDRMADWIAANQDLINQKIQKVFEGISKAGKILYKMWDNGLIPAVLAAVGVFKILYPLITTIIALKKAWAIAQLTLNAVLLANPVGLIIAGVALLIAGIILLVKNFDKVKEVAKSLWGSVKTYFGKIRDFVLNIWNKIKEPFEKVIEFFGGGVKGASLNIDEAQSRGMAAAGAGGIQGLVGANDGVINSTTTVQRAMLDVNFHGTPAGTTFKQKGVVDPITLNDGYGMAGL